ncbi:MAG: hypothetical protein QW579_04305 [Desulfurococcaceae archaeon]
MNPFYILVGLIIAVLITAVLLSVGENVIIQFNQTAGGTIPGQYKGVWDTIASFAYIVIAVIIAVTIILFIISSLRGAIR